MERTHKEQEVATINAIANQSFSLVVADARGVPAKLMTDFRKQGKNNGVSMKVVRNTLAQRALQDTPYECVIETLKGPTLLAFSTESPGDGARLFKDFTKIEEHLEVKGLAIEGNFYEPTQIDMLAQLPNRDAALSMLAGALLAPVEKLAWCLSDVPGSFVRILSAMSEQKDATA